MKERKKNTKQMIRWRVRRKAEQIDIGRKTNTEKN